MIANGTVSLPCGADQAKRGTAVASAAYRAGEKLHNLWDGETHDYTRKGGVILSEIMLPEYAPERLFDRYTLWNEVEQIEKHYKAQLAYSFDMALQNEFSLDENIALAREFVQKYFVSDGMICDLAVHQPDRGDGGIPNPHFHVLVPIRPLNADGTWGGKTAPGLSFGQGWQPHQKRRWKLGFRCCSNYKLGQAGNAGLMA